MRTYYENVKVLILSVFCWWMVVDGRNYEICPSHFHYECHSLKFVTGKSVTISLGKRAKSKHYSFWYCWNFTAIITWMIEIWMCWLRTKHHPTIFTEFWNYSWWRWIATEWRYFERKFTCKSLFIAHVSGEFPSVTCWRKSSLWNFDTNLQSRHSKFELYIVIHLWEIRPGMIPMNFNFGYSMMMIMTFIINEYHVFRS